MPERLVSTHTVAVCLFPLIAEGLFQGLQFIVIGLSTGSSFRAQQSLASSKLVPPEKQELLTSKQLALPVLTFLRKDRYSQTARVFCRQLLGRIFGSTFWLGKWTDRSRMVTVDFPRRITAVEARQSLWFQASFRHFFFHEVHWRIGIITMKSYDAGRGSDEQVMKSIEHVCLHNKVNIDQHRST